MSLRSLPIHRHVLSCGFVAALLVSPAFARSIHPGPWQSSVYAADFIGVVECKTAAYPKGDDGNGHHHLFVDCEVIDSIKGDKPGDSFTVYCGTDDPHFDYGDPKPEAGKQFALSVVAEYSPEGDPPVAPAKYQLGLLSPMTPNPDKEYPPGFNIFSPTPDRPENFTAFQKAAKAFLLLPLEEQAFQCMKRVAMAEAEPRSGGGRSYPELAKVTNVSDTASLVKALLDAADSNKECTAMVAHILELGRHECLAALESNSANAQRILGPRCQRLKSTLAWRISKGG
jgi:hypothetical protein